MQIRAASSNGLDATIRDHLRRTEEHYTFQQRLWEKSLVDFRRLDEELTSAEKPNSVLRLEHSLARASLLHANRSGQFADVTHGLQQLRIILQGRPYISALEPVARRLINLDFAWREDLVGLRQIWYATILGSYNNFVQRRMKVVLMAYLIFEKSVTAYTHMIKELQELQRSEPLPRKGSPSSKLFKYMVKWYMKYLMTLHRDLIDCEKVYKQILFDRLRREDPRYWVHDAIMYPFELSIAQTDICVNRARNIRQNFARKTSREQPASPMRLRQLRQLLAMVKMADRLANLNREIADLVFSFELFVAHQVQQMSGEELEERTNKAKETVRYFEELERKFDSDFGQRLHSPPRTFRQYFEYVTNRRQSNEQRAVVFRRVTLEKHERSIDKTAVLSSPTS